MRTIHGSCLAIAILLLAADQPASAQVRQVQGGNALDANPMAGSGGYNTARPVSSGINSNLIVTGNVTGGRAFRGYSPIQDPTSLQIGVPSSALSNFVRDSVGLPSVQSGLSNYAPRPYFSPTQTAVTPGIVQNQALLPRQTTGTYQVSQYRPEMPVTPLASIRGPGPLTPELPNAAPGWQPTGTGMFRPDVVAVQPSQIGRNPLTEFPLTTPAEVSPGETSPSRQGELPPESPLSQLIRPRPTDREIPTGPQAQPQVGAVEPEVETVQSTLLADMQRYTQAIQAAVQPDDRQDQAMQAATRSPNEEMLLADPGLGEQGRARLRAEARQDQAARLVEARLAHPIRTLAGERRTPIDQLLGQAEQLMQQGEYYRASQVYNSLLTMTPDNALAWLGRANALLAAGEYRSAYLALEQGIGQYPDILRFDFDLPALVGRREVLDIRRAEIERTLVVNPDYRLRFLLGYLEYFSGLRNLGLQTLQQAAAAAPADSIVPQAHQVLASQTRQAPATQPAP